MKWRWHRVSRNISRSRRFPSSSSSIATGVSNISHFPSTASTTTVLSEWLGEESIDRSSIKRLQANEALNDNFVELCMDEFDSEYSPERRPSSYTSATNFAIRGEGYTTETVNAITHFPSTTSSTSLVLSEWLGEETIDRCTIKSLKTIEAMNDTFVELCMDKFESEYSPERQPSSYASATNFAIRGGSYSTETVNAITHFPSTTSSTSLVMSEWLGEETIDRSTIKSLKTNEALNETLTKFWMMDITELENENSTAGRPSFASATNLSIRGGTLDLIIKQLKLIFFSDTQSI